MCSPVKYRHHEVGEQVWQHNPRLRADARREGRGAMRSADRPATSKPTEVMSSSGEELPRWKQSDRQAGHTTRAR